MSSWRIVLYSNRCKRPTCSLTYGDDDDDDDSDYPELVRCDYDNSVRNNGMFSGFRALPFFILKPKLKIESCYLKRDDGSRTCYFYIRNVGKRTANGVQVKVKIEWYSLRGLTPFRHLPEYRTLNPNFPAEFRPIDINPNDEPISIKVCTLRSNDKSLTIPCVEDGVFGDAPHLILKLGYYYELFIRLVGKNFLDKTVWHLRLVAYDYNNFVLSQQFLTQEKMRVLFPEEARKSWSGR